MVRATGMAAVLLLACASGCGPSAEGGGGVGSATLGGHAPVFTLSDTEGRQFSLSALTGTGPVVLLFFCNT